MWICPECKNKNIDNSSVCVKCFKGRMCSNCENPSAEAVCPYCNADSRKETWVSEEKYAAYTATVNSSVGDPASANNVSGNHKADNSTGKITPLPESDVKSEGASKTSSKTGKTGVKNNKASKKKSKSSFKAGLTAMLALVFTAGIGENRDEIRAAACRDLEYLGIKLDEEKNANTHRPNGNVLISAPDSKVPVYVIPTNEELVIASDTEAIVRAL